jgi:hypothetical protein
MSTAIQEEPVVGRPPTPEENELIDWALESSRKRLTTAQEGLRQLITLTTAVLGGSAALLGQLPAPVVFKLSGMVLLVISLAVALYGSLPKEVQVANGSLDEFKAARDAYVRRKLKCLDWAAGLLVGGFAAMILGFVVSAVR